MIKDEIPLNGKEYVTVFSAIARNLTTNQRAMLKYHLEQDRPVTASELANHVDYSSYSAVNVQYGRVGRYLREAHPALRRMPGQKSFAFASFHKIPRADGGYSEWEWTLHTPVRHALRQATWL